MHINVVTLFPEFFSGPLSAGLLQRASAGGILSLSLHNPRDKTTDNYHRVDDRPYGGGPGMVMLPGPLAEVLREVGFSMRGSEAIRCAGNDIHSPGNDMGLPGDDMRLPGNDMHSPCDDANRPDNDADRSGDDMRRPGRLIYLSPKGRPLTQAVAAELAREERITLLCGRYEGIDARIEELFPVECLSVGDFVLNGGEAAALCLIEAVGRLLPGFMGHEDSGEEESFSQGLLEYPHYTRPEAFGGLAVPEALRSGDHGRIARWRRQASLQTTVKHRPDMLAEAPLYEEDYALLRQTPMTRRGRNLYAALLHYPVLDKQKNSVAVSLTNLDIHDIARSSCTYGLGGYYIVTPIQDQLRLLEEILAHWTRGAGSKSNPDRDAALSLVRGCEALETAVTAVREKTGQDPFVVATTAVGAPKGTPVMGCSHISGKLLSRPVLLLFGTGQGLAPEAFAASHAALPPIRALSGYNHLSVRSAAAVLFDRILGDLK